VDKLVVMMDRGVDRIVEKAETLVAFVVVKGRVMLMMDEVHMDYVMDLQWRQVHHCNKVFVDRVMMHDASEALHVDARVAMMLLRVVEDMPPFDH
jgi:hypothetical protein